MAIFSPRPFIAWMSARVTLGMGQPLADWRRLRADPGYGVICAHVDYLGMPPLGPVFGDGRIGEDYYRIPLVNQAGGGAVDAHLPRAAPPGGGGCLPASA